MVPNPLYCSVCFLVTVTWKGHTSTLHKPNFLSNPFLPLVPAANKLAGWSDKKKKKETKRTKSRSPVSWAHKKKGPSGFFVFFFLVFFYIFREALNSGTGPLGLLIIIYVSIYFLFYFFCFLLFLLSLAILQSIVLVNQLRLMIPQLCFFFVLQPGSTLYQAPAVALLFSYVTNKKAALDIMLVAPHS